MGPAGLVSIDDSEVMRLAQLGATADPDAFAFVEMGGTDTERADHIVTESAIRAFYVVLPRGHGAVTPTDLFAHYVDILDEGPLEVWPTFFTEHATYKIVARENQIRDLPLA